MINQQPIFTDVDLQEQYGKDQQSLLFVKQIEFIFSYFEFQSKLLKKNERKKRKTQSQDDPNSRRTEQSVIQVSSNHDSDKLQQEYDQLLESYQQKSNRKNSKAYKSDFQTLKVLGKGGYGKVYLVQRKSDLKFYAMKVIKKERVKNPKQKIRTKTERYILEKFKHPFLMHLKYAFQTKDKLFMIIDYCPGGELFFHLQRVGIFNEKITKFYSACILLGILELHKNNIIYRDLKPENILIDKYGYVVITDFGLSKEHVTDRTESFCGTAEYMAPEVILKRPYSKSVDWWSLGALMYEMLQGLPPFFTNKRDKTFGLILNTDFVFTRPISEAAMDLISKLLQKDPTQRLGNGTLDGVEIMKHPFFEGVNWEMLLSRKIQAPFIPDKHKVNNLMYFPQEFTEMQISQDDQLRFSNNKNEKGLGDSCASQHSNEWGGFSFHGSRTQSSTSQILYA
eukprot:403377427